MKRRDFLGALAALGVAPGIFTAAGARAAVTPAAITELETAFASQRTDSAALARHIANRIGFGITPAQIGQIEQMGVANYIAAQLKPDVIDDADCERRLELYSSLNVTVPDVYNEMLTMEQETKIADDLIGAMVLRSIYSKRQLFEVMVNFWTEHFSIYHGKAKCQVLKTIDDRDVIRKHALGKFRDLLGASAKSPAMLLYLDNVFNRVDAPNENYAREVMELHTLSPGDLNAPNYTETDVKQVAHALSGWTFVRSRVDAFTFDGEQHLPGAVTVLDRVIPAGGIEQGEAVLDMLAAHPATARHIATKLCRRFISDDPPESVIARVAEAFRASDGDIRTVLETLFASDEFIDAPPKFKRPYEFVIGIFRNLDIDTTGPLRQPVYRALKHMNHLPFNWLPPNGYSDRGTDWVGNFMERWNVVVRLLIEDKFGYPIDLVWLGSRNKIAPDYNLLVDFYADHLLGRALESTEYDALSQFATKGKIPNESRMGQPVGRRALADSVALMMMSPDYQFR